MYLSLGLGALLLFAAARRNNAVMDPQIRSTINDISPNSVVGGSPSFQLPQNAYNPVGPANLLGIENPLIQSNALSTLTNTQVSSKVTWGEPLSSETPSTFIDQGTNIVGVQQSLLPINYGGVIINAASAVTPTSYNYSTPISAAVWSADAYPQPQYILNQQVQNAPNVITSSSF